jgi:hypothetical protein
MSTKISLTYFGMTGGGRTVIAAKLNAERQMEELRLDRCSPH